MRFYIPSLNGLRALCIIMVIFYHFDMHHFLPDHGVFKIASLAFFNGPLGVNIFFAISGFLITTLLLKEEADMGFISLRGFYYRRIIRIFPAYYFLLLVYIILSIFGYFTLSSIDWISSFTYTKQFFPNTSHETAHLWSLSVEEVFYLIWPLLFIYFKKFRLSISIFCLMACCLVRCITYNAHGANLVNIIYTSGDALIIGCIIALHRDQIVHWMSNRKYLMLMIFPSIVMSVVFYKYIYHLELAGQFNSKPQISRFFVPMVYGFLGQIGTVTNILIGFLILYSISFENLWFKFLNLPIMNYIGKISYSLYLWQEIFTADRAYLHKLPIVLILVMIVGSACISYYFIEKPFLKLKHKFNFKPVPQPIS